LVGGIVAGLEADLEPFPDAIVSGQRGRPEPEHASEARARPVRVLEVLLSEGGPDLCRPVIGAVERPSPPRGIRIPTGAQASQEGLLLFVSVGRLQGEGGALEPRVGQDEIEDIAKVAVLAILLRAREPAKSRADTVRQLAGHLPRSRAGRVGGP